MFDRNDRNSVTNKTIIAWIIGSLTSSMSSSVAYSLETEEPITVNKVRTPQPWVRFSAEYVRCFCNLPQCVSTGYMCKSSGGGCFSNFLDVGHHPKDYRGRHGCLELLSDNENKALCETDIEKSPNVHKKKSLIFCCHHDMCNHVDSPQTKDLINNTLLGEPADSSANTLNTNIGNLQQPIDYTNSQVWFRAATIAVPVCGAVILFVLIALAVKILRSENQNSTNHKLYEHQVCQNKSGCERTYDNILRKPHLQKCAYSYHGEDLQRIQVPLLIQNEISTQHSGSKNETNAKLNLMQGEYVINDYKEVNNSVVLDIEKATPKCSKTNLVNHVHNDDKCLDVKYIA